MFIPFSFPNIPNILCYFQIRLDTHSINDTMSFDSGIEKDIVQLNRKQLFDACNVAQISEIKQVHGTHTVFSPCIYDIDTVSQDMQEADGIATDKTNVGLIIKTADCQPIFLTEKSGKYIMALHVGWRGNASHYIQKAVSEFCTVYSIRPDTICAVRGPSLSPMRSEFVNASTEFLLEDMIYYDEERKIMNLWQMTKGHLTKSGIPEEQIYSIDICTYSSPYFFSYREDKKTGRQLSMIVQRNIHTPF